MLLIDHSQDLSANARQGSSLDDPCKRAPKHVIGSEEDAQEEASKQIFHSSCGSACFQLLGSTALPLPSISKKLEKEELSANHFGFLSIPLGNCLHDVKIWGSHEGWCLILPGCPDPCNRGDRM